MSVRYRGAEKEAGGAVSRQTRGQEVQTMSAKTISWFGPNDCELCGKPAKPPNMILSKGHAFHIGCMADEFDRLRKRYPALLDAAHVRGTYGPWADDWDEADARYTMSAEDYAFWLQEKAAKEQSA